MIIPALGFADVLEVPGQYPSIQEAIDAAKTGDTVLVDPGTYNENIDFKGKEITVQSSAGSATTIIDGGQLDSVVIFSSGETASSVLEGFELTNGFADEGGGIHCSNNSHPTINDCLIRNNEAFYYGGGIYLSNSNALIVDCSLKGNISWDGGGISCYYASPVIERTEFRGNTANGFGGGAIYCYNESNFKLINSYIYKNTGSTGGGILCGLSSPALTNSVIYDNDGTFQGGGICLFSYAFIEITNCVIRENFAPVDWQIALLDLSTALVKHSNVQNPGGWPGVNNLNGDPLFVNANAGNFHIQPGSINIDNGTETAPDLPATDWEGDERIIDGKLNMVLAPDIGVDELWYMNAEPREIISTEGGTVDFALDAREGNGGRTYLVVASASGYSPGWNLGQVTLPVNRDAITDLFLSLVNTPLFLDFLGDLDTAGEAFPQMNVPELSPGIGDFTLYFAFTLNNPFNFASNHVEIHFTE
jgi:predicted outer membrane repeat protein